MKKIFLALILIFSAFPAYAANVQIKVDGVIIKPDVTPDLRHNRTMAPLRVIGENLGAQVNWSGSEVTLSKSDIQVKFKLHNGAVVKKGKNISLDVKPYIKKNRFMVPLRFLAETFGCNVNYENSVATVATEPLVINSVKVKTLQWEYHMTMGGVVQHINGNAFNKAIYDIFLKNKGKKTEAPAHYSWMVDIDTLGAYYKNGQYDFLDENGNSLQRYDIYSLVETHPAEILAQYPKFLLYDVTANQWYLFNKTAGQSINQLIDIANKNGFLKVISDTVV